MILRQYWLPYSFWSTMEGNEFPRVLVFFISVIPEKSVWSTCRIVHWCFLWELYTTFHFLMSSRRRSGPLLTCWIGTSWVMGLGIGSNKFPPFFLSRVTITAAMKSMPLVFSKNNFLWFYKRKLNLVLCSHSSALWVSVGHTTVHKGKATDWLKYSLLVIWVNNNWGVLWAALGTDSHKIIRSQALASSTSWKYIHIKTLKIQLRNNRTSTNKSAKTSTWELMGKGLELGGVIPWRLSGKGEF